MKMPKCKTHMDRDVITKCGWCEKGICEECITQAGGKKFCADCANRFKLAR